jgi:hypothetical protein
MDGRRSCNAYFCVNICDERVGGGNSLSKLRCPPANLEENLVVALMACLDPTIKRTESRSGIENSIEI